MALARILGAVGRTMIAAGVLLLLFVAYQLWGTGVETAAAQRRLTTEFEQRLAATTTTEAPATTTTTAQESDEAVEPEPGPEAGEPVERGDPVARIQIPRLGVDYIVLEGVEISIVNEGPAHFPSTPMPGQPGNSAIAGHRTTFGAPFHRIDELDPGDRIEILTPQGEFSYEVIPQVTPAANEDEEDVVRGHYIVDPYAMEILDDKGDNRVTLMACHPKYSAAQRIIVEAVLIDEPAEPTPVPTSSVDDEDPLAAGLLTETHDGALGPALAWSLLAGAIWLGAWLLGRAWKRWPIYVLATPMFTVVLFVAFQNISRLLPAGY